MKAQLWTAAIALALSGAAFAGEMKGGSSTDAGSANPAEKGARTPKQPNETQPGMGEGDTKGSTKGAKSGMKGDGTTSKSGMKGDGTSSNGGGMNAGNPAEKGTRTPSQPNETQPGTGSNKK
ncbi:MAG TPA: hypothetical protein VGP15_15480 [Burkholderiales bacterium]|nr:hypothetical protein [Burkholderiales bacterium]